jgi:biotin carboxyl carrier protein
VVSAQAPQDASLVRAGDAWSLIVGSRSYAVSFVEPARGELIVYVNGRAVPVAGVTGQRSRGTRGAGAEAHGGNGPVSITAPMSGRIVRLLVKQGDRVAARQGLVVVEAMKMENELRAPRDGVVTDVKVVEGASVEARAVLITIE